MKTIKRDTPYKRLGAVIRGRRKALGLTQHVVAAQVGVSQGLLSKMERGLNAIDAVEWWRLTRALEIPPDVLHLTLEGARARAVKGGQL